MRDCLLTLAGIIAVGHAASGSMECYVYDEDGNAQYYNGELMVTTCLCESQELANFVRHVGNECFSDGVIPNDVEDGTYYKACNNNNNNNNNNGDDDCGDSAAGQEFWCDCLASYLNKYGRFPEGCYVPMLSNAMEEIAGMTMEAAWGEQGCEWFDFKARRVVPEDVAINISDTGSFAITTDPDTWIASVAFSFDFAEVVANYEAATGSELKCNVDENDDGDDDDGNDNGEDPWDDVELAWEIRRLPSATVDGGGNKRRLQDEDEDEEDKATPAPEPTNGTPVSVQTRYGSDCSTENTGEVFVSYAYPPPELDEYGYASQEAGEREVFVGDLTETLGALEVCGDSGEDDNNNNNNNNNNNQVGCGVISWPRVRNNGDDDDDDDKEDSAAMAAASLASALSYQLYNKNDIDGYSIVISCPDEAESQDNGNDNQDSEDCEYEEAELCESRVSKYAIPIFCSNFYVQFDAELSEDDADPEGLCSDNYFMNKEDCEKAGETWTDAQNGEFEDDNDNGIPDSEEETNGFILVSEAEAMGKTIGLVILGIACLGLCCYAWKVKKGNSYSKAPDGNKEDTPLASGQQL